MVRRSWNPFKHQSRIKAGSGLHEDLISPTNINAVYYPNWKVYRSQPPSSLNLKFITHIFYAFGGVKEAGTICFTDEYADIGIDINGVKGCVNNLRSIKAQYPHIKTILSLGGGGDGSAPFPTVAGNGSVRSVFAQNARHIVDVHGFDGIDSEDKRKSEFGPLLTVKVDWEHPSDPIQGENYVQMLGLLRQTLPSPQYLLTAALPAGTWALKNIDLRRASANVDLINLMAYDFSGPWTKLCGFQSQLYSPTNPYNDDAKTCGDSAVTYLISNGVPSQKILLGIPAYGRSFLGATCVGAQYNGAGGDEGTFEFKDLPRPGAIVCYDNKVGAVFCVGGDGGFVTYDDPVTVRTKAEYAKQRGLAGLFYWTGTGDSNDAQSLVEAGYHTLHPS